ncbi:MAG: hypothetical protein ABSE86_36000 [Bryobacteraceae bacterium]|jgi:hypothetical protein
MLSAGEATRVWLWIFGPQLAFLLTLVMWGPSGAARVISGLSLEIQFLIVGPSAVALALRQE